MARRALAALFASPPQALAPFMPARRALQPDPLGRTVGDLRRPQVAVLGGMPKVQDTRVQALGAIEALQRQPPAAVRASDTVERPRPHGQPPTVTALAAPPHSGGIAALDVGRLEGPVRSSSHCASRSACPNRKHHSSKLTLSPASLRKRDHLTLDLPWPMPWHARPSAASSARASSTSESKGASSSARPCSSSHFRGFCLHGLATPSWTPMF